MPRLNATVTAKCTALDSEILIKISLLGLPANSMEELCISTENFIGLGEFDQDFACRGLCLYYQRIQLNSYLSQQKILLDSMANFDHGLCFDSQRIQLKSLYITTEHFLK